jgi:hypothetical protein
MSDRVERLREVAQARHAETLHRTWATLWSLARDGQTITVRGVADAVGVSRSCLYASRNCSPRSTTCATRRRAGSQARQRINGPPLGPYGHSYTPTARRSPASGLRTTRSTRNWAATSAPSAMPQSPSDHDLSRTCPCRGSPENTGISAGGSREADLPEPPYTAHTCRSRRIESLAFGGDRRRDPVCPRQALSPFDVSPLHA